MKAQSIKEFNPIQQKGRRIPIQLQEWVEADLNKLIDQKHIIKLDRGSDKQFISTLVMTVKGPDSKTGFRFRKDQQIFIYEQISNA